MSTMEHGLVAPDWPPTDPWQRGRIGVAMRVHVITHFQESMSAGVAL